MHIQQSKELGRVIADPVLGSPYGLVLTKFEQSGHALIQDKTSEASPPISFTGVDPIESVKMLG